MYNKYTLKYRANDKSMILILNLNIWKNKIFGQINQMYNLNLTMYTNNYYEMNNQTI